jgi:hypothetical protein
MKIKTDRKANIMSHQGFAASSPNPQAIVATPDIDWDMVYEKLGMLSDLQRFRETAAGRETTDNPTIWRVPVLRGVRVSRVAAALVDAGSGVWFEMPNPDVIIRDTFRDPNRGSYVVGFLRTVEADPANSGMSYSTTMRLAGYINILEQVLLGVGYYLTTGQPLDAKSATLCFGSLGPNELVPGMGWHDVRRIYTVNWFGQNQVHPNLRPRSVVS